MLLPHWLPPALVTMLEKYRQGGLCRSLLQPAGPTWQKSGRAASTGGTASGVGRDFGSGGNGYRSMGIHGEVFSLAATKAFPQPCLSTSTYAQASPMPTRSRQYQSRGGRDGEHCHASLLWMRLARVASVPKTTCRTRSAYMASIGAIACNLVGFSSLRSL